LQLGRELVAADPSSDATRNPQTLVNDQTGGRQVMYRPSTLHFSMLTSAGSKARAGEARTGEISKTRAGEAGPGEAGPGETSKTRAGEVGAAA
jgi:hypothetical protein